MADQVFRSAARVAAIVAVPVALLAGIGVFALLGGAFAGPVPVPPGTTAPAPVPTAAVEMTARSLDARKEIVCRALVSQLPGNLSGQARRLVTAGQEQNAAYGEPPITVACGVEEPELAPTERVWNLSGVCWYASEEPDAAVWTTLDREVPVRVTVPAAYPGPGSWVGGFSSSIIETILTAGPAPSGCH